jgi:hypothetical protein
MFLVAPRTWNSEPRELETWNLERGTTGSLCVVVNGNQLDQLEVAGTVWRGDVDLVACFLVQDGASDRRGRRDESPLGVGVFRMTN